MIEILNPPPDGELIYISGGITGVPDYKERFAQAEKKLSAMGYKVVNPAKMDDVLPKGLSYEQYMTADLALLSLCSSIYMLRGYQVSCGANRELGFALAKDMNILYE